MIFQRTWGRFVSEPKRFLAISLGLLSALLAYSVMAAALVALTGWGLFAALLAPAPAYVDQTVFILSMIGQFSFVFLLLALVCWAASAFIDGGVYGSLAAFRRGETVGPGLFWVMGVRHFKRMLGLTFLSALISLVVEYVCLLIPVVGWLLFFLAVPMVWIYFSVYPAYLIIAEDRGVIDAIGTMTSLVTKGFREAVLATLVSWLFTAAITLGMVILFIPVLGVILYLAGWLVACPFMTYYYIERFETNVRPLM